MKEKKDKDFIKKPIYPGGASAMKKFIQENLRYPEEAKEKRTEGTVLLKYDIDHQGNVTDAKVIKGIGDGCDEEAMRVVKLLKFKIPSTPRKLKVLFHKEARISFNLKNTPSEKEPVNYQIALSRKPAQKKTGKVYSYTIEL